MVLVRLLGDAQRSIDAALDWSVDKYGEVGAVRYAALIKQSIVDFAASPSARIVRPIGKPRNGVVLPRYDLRSSQNRVPPGTGRVANPRHFIVGRLDSGMLRILFIAHDSMKPGNVVRRSRRSDVKDD